MSVIGSTPGIGVDTSRIGTDANLKKAGERFEAVFTGMMLASMRKTKLADTLFESKAADQFRDMWDQKVAETMASSAPMGIGKAMTDFLSRSAAATPAAPDASGADEAQKDSAQAGAQTVVTHGVTERAGTKSG